jgi:putative copper export protein
VFAGSRFARVIIFLVLAVVVIGLILSTVSYPTTV